MDDVRPSVNTDLSLPTLQVIRRNGAAVQFNLDKISIAITKAFLAVEGNQSGASQRVRDQVANWSITR